MSDLSAAHRMPELRFDVLRNEWVAYATERNDRTFLPTDHCPLCPSGPGGGSEVPLDDFEVVVYTPEHELTLAQLPADRVKLLIDVWTDRYFELGSRPEVTYVYIFENKGEEVGVTLHHPHGQIYAIPFVPPVAAAELDAARERLNAGGRCLHCEQIERESVGPRSVFSEDSMVSFVPDAARWPCEVHLYPR